MNSELEHCSNALLQEYSDGALSDEAGGKVAAHLASCASCRRSAVAFRRLDEALRRLPHESADVRFTGAVLDGIGGTRRADPAYRFLVWAGAAVGMTAVAGLILGILFSTGVLDPGVTTDQEAPGSSWMGIVPEMLTPFASISPPKDIDIWIFVIAVAGTLGLADYLIRRRVVQR